MHKISLVALAVLCCFASSPAADRKGQDATAAPGDAQPAATSEAKPPSWAKVSAEQVAAAKTLGLPVAFENSAGMRFVLIPAGTFTMGSQDSAADVARRCAMPNAQAGWFCDEHPRRKVTLTGAFYLAIHEVTQGAYEKATAPKGGKDTGKKKPKPKPKPKTSGSEIPDEFTGTNKPAGMLTPADAEKFCKMLSAGDGRTYALPTEAQWEYACRAGTMTPFSFGETISTDQANYHGDYTYGKGVKGKNRQMPLPVGTLPPNAWGLYDMHGNVSEWCADRYEKYPSDAETDPQGSTEGRLYVLRGGSWRSYPGACRSAFRSRSDARSHNIGVRVRCDIPAKAAPKK